MRRPYHRRRAPRHYPRSQPPSTLDGQRFILALAVVGLFAATYLAALALPEGPVARQALPIVAQQLTLVVGYYFGKRDR